MNSYYAGGRTCSAISLARQRWGGAKPAIIIGLVVLIAVIVPLGVYIVANIAFPNGTTSADLSAPDTGITIRTPAAMTPNPAPANNRPAASNRPLGKTMDLLVIDHDTKQPVSDIEVRTDGMSRFTGHSGADGHARVPIPSGQADNFAVRVYGKGYVPKRLQWASYQPQLQGEVPTSYTMEMEHSTKVSGRIMGLMGHPVAGANVYLDFTKKYSNPHEQVDLSPYDQTRQLKSGEDGRWEFNGAPMDCDQIGLTAWDYKFVTGDYWSPQPFSPVSKLYDGTAVFILHRGFMVEGVVLDPQGSPVVGASVALGQQRNSSNAIPARNTDASGHFSYQFEPGQQVILTVQAKGFAPELLQMAMPAHKQSVTIQLSKPHRISGKVVNAKGKPVRDAYISLQSWRGFQTIEANFRTDGAGNFHWNEAPADPVTVYINARDARGVDAQVLTPDQDNVIKLSAVSRVRGTVTDAQTGQLIDHFHVTFGILWNAEQAVTWQRGWNPGITMEPGGKFSFTDSFSYPGVAVRIETPGYMPAESRIIKRDEGDAELDLKLKPAKDIVLTIRSSDGKLVADATAVMAIPGQQVNILNGREVQFSMVPQQTSGPDGHIDFSPQPGVFAITIFANAGFAEANQDALAKSEDITLTPWGRVQGRMMVGSKPDAQQDVDLSQSQNMPYDPAAPRIFYQHSAKTDDDGRFVFDRVSPGTWNISRRINIAPNSWSNSTLETAQVSAGQTVIVNVGGMGRPVVGTVIVPPELASRTDWIFSFCQMSTHVDMVFPSVPMPDEIKNGSRESQMRWYQAWAKTDAGKAMMLAQQKAMSGRRSYSFSVATDGTFRVEDVLAGTYDVSVNLRTTTGQNGMSDTVGMGWARLVVPEMPGGRSDEPLQMESIPINKAGKYHPGDVVYDLPMKSTDGKDLKLSDFRGKYLLLDCREGPNNPPLAPLKAVYKAFGRDDRLAMLTLTLNFMLGQHTKSPEIAWHQAGLDPMRMEGGIIFTNFGILNNAPDAWLIGPDGKVVAEDLRGDAIMSAVTGALGSPATQSTTAP
jgi:protocatechuate 3,4-dioxygenase beta subunit